MAAIFESTIKTSPIGRWYIELVDTEDSTAEPVVCLDIYDYAEKIEKMGEKYGGDIDVIWSSDEGVTPEQINEVRMQINAYEAEQQAIRDGIVQPMDETSPSSDTPDP